MANLEGVAAGSVVNPGPWTTVAVGEEGIIVSSLGGNNWVAQYSGVTSDLHGVAFGDGQFVAVGDAGEVTTSPDGVNWTPQNSGTTQALRTVMYDKGLFFVGGDNGAILTSADAKTWRQFDLVPALNVRGIAPAAGGYLVAGDNGDIVLVGGLGGPGLSAPQVTGHGVTMTFSGTPQQSYRLQYSPDLSNWTDLFEFTPTGSMTNLADSSAVGTQRFYRVVTE